MTLAFAVAALAAGHAMPVGALADVFGTGHHCRKPFFCPDSVFFVIFMMVVDL